MGISRRNPKGNFNWQSRYLKKRAICCGELNEPFDCDALGPTLQITGNYICKSSNPRNETVCVFNTQPGQSTTTSYEWYEGGPGGPLYYNSYGGASCIEFTVLQQIPGTTTFWLVVTNQFGCVVEQYLDIYVTNVPEFSTVIVDPTDPCVPDVLNPLGQESNGEITVTITNPDPNALEYSYTITRDTIYSSTTVDPGTVFSWTDLCYGSYDITVTVYRLIDGVVTAMCSSSNTVFIGDLILTWDDIANAPVVNPNDPAEWNAISFSDIVFVGATVIGNSVYLAPSNRGFLRKPTDPVASPLFTNHIVSVEDRAGCVISVVGAFQNCPVFDTVILPSCLNIGLFSFTNASALTTVTLPSVETIGLRAFEGTGAFDAVFPACTSIGNLAFYNSNIFNADFPVLEAVGTFSFSFTANLTTISFPNVHTVYDSSFRSSGIIDLNFPSLVTAYGASFAGCSNATSLSMPMLTTVSGLEFMNGCQSLTSLYLPELTTAGTATFRDCYGLVTADLPKLVTCGEKLLYKCYALQTVNLPLISDLGNEAFAFDGVLTSVYMPVVQSIGINTSDNGVFGAITGQTVTVTVPIIFQTIYVPGNTLERDLYFLSIYNTVTFIWT